jgi:hypothetical protein
VKRAIADLGPAELAREAPTRRPSFGDAVLIAVPNAALPAIRDEVGLRLRGKVVIDPNNPVPARDGDMASRRERERRRPVSTAALLPGREDRCGRFIPGAPRPWRARRTRSGAAPWRWPGSQPNDAEGAEARHAARLRRGLRNPVNAGSLSVVEGL